METIKNYLEAMFAGLPNTPEVRKARSELLQMMEDKYNELIAEGKSENTAVGTVISEFGNLDELAEDLNLTKEVEETKKSESELPHRIVNSDDAKGYLEFARNRSLLIAVGVFFCIASVACPILNIGTYGMMGVAMMFLCIALGVGLIVAGSLIGSDWKFIKTELCRLDMATCNYVKERRRSFEPVRTLCMAIGVILCIICWVPNMLYVSIGSNLAPALMFIFIGFGVLLIIYSSGVQKSFGTLLNLNDINTISGSYTERENKPVKYKNKTAETIATIYWPVCTSLYLIISFLTFRWDITWIIWPIAGVMHNAVMINCRADED